MQNIAAGLKRRWPNSDESAPLASGSFSKLDSIIESILRKKFGACQDTRKSCAALVARIKFLEHHTAEGNNETLQAKFVDIICEAEVKLLDAAIDSLSRDFEANQYELGEREEDIDGTIAQWSMKGY